MVQIAAGKLRPRTEHLSGSLADAGAGARATLIALRSSDAERLQSAQQRWALDSDASGKGGRGCPDPGSDAGREVALHSRGHSNGAPVPLEAFKLEAKALGPLPQVGIVLVAAVREDSVPDVVKGVLGLEAGGFGCLM